MDKIHFINTNREIQLQDCIFCEYIYNIYWIYKDWYLVILILMIKLDIIILITLFNDRYINQI